MRFITMISVCFVFLFSNSAFCTPEIFQHSLVKYAVSAVTPLLDVFQVYPPVLTPTSMGQLLTNGSAEDPATRVQEQSSSCVVTQTLMEYSFANSYGNPFVGPYTPPADCDFNRVTFNVTVVSAGRQFDRLALVYFGDTELWRTSTAEPTQNGIVWTYIKDMSAFLTLFDDPQTLIFDLGNIVDSTYTAPFNATLQATFFHAEDTVTPADMILPISARLGSSGKASAWQVPPSNASNTLTLPRNINKAVFTVSATGQIDEEFWFGNVFSSQVNTFPEAGTLLGYSPFREVQLYIDGMLAGVVWPFPIIFTGGVVPGLWRPIVGIDAFDLREDEIDITPWLPMLCDGNSHTFEIRIAGINDDGNNHGTLTESVGSYWVITGKIFIWLDPTGSITTGSTLSRSVPAPTISISSSIQKTSNGTNETLTYDTSVSRQLAISSHVTTSNSSKEVIWYQKLNYTNRGMLTQYGLVQFINQETIGVDVASTGYARRVDYPIYLNTTYMPIGATGFALTGEVNRGQNIAIAGQPVFPTGLQSFEEIQGVQGPRFQGSNLETTQNGTAYYQSSGNSSYSFGSTQQDMMFSGLRVDTVTSTGGTSFPQVQGSTELYQRHVVAVNGTVVDNNESLEGRTFESYSALASPAGLTNSFAAGSVRKALGRGPGPNPPPAK